MTKKTRAELEKENEELKIELEAARRACREFSGIIGNVHVFLVMETRKGWPLDGSATTRIVKKVLEMVDPQLRGKLG